MARPITFGESEDAQLGRAGAVSLSRMRGEMADERRYQEQATRADAREDRMAESQNLDDDVKRWEFEKQKRLDENAARMKIETDKEAILANDELFKINTADDNAPEKLAEWGAKYFRVLDDKTGSPRLIRQFQINQSRAENRQIAKARYDEIRFAREEKENAAKARADELRANAEATRAEVKAGGLVPSGASVGDDGKLRTTYTAPDAGMANPGKPDSYDRLAADRKAAVEIRPELTPEQRRQFDKREQALITAGRQQPATPAVAPVKPAQTPEEWLSLNPNDPRAPAIRAKLGIK